MSRELEAVAARAARRGGEVLRREFRRTGLAVESKAAHDFVTSADRASERIVVETLRAAFPEHSILTEESGRLPGGGDHEWVIDPLDGTTNYLQGLPVYAVSVACRRGEETLAGAILDPERDELWSAARGAGARWNGRPMAVSGTASLAGAFLATGFPFKARGVLDVYLEIFRDVFLSARAVRRCGAAALDLAYTAAGVFDGFFEFQLSAWDIAAGALMIEEAGGTVTDLDGGRRYLDTGNVVAGAPGVAGELRRRIAARVGERRLAELLGNPARRRP